MEQADMHFIAIIGGFWQLDESQAAPAKKAAKAIGEELAKAGLGLVVFESAGASLEPHVVDGYVAGLSEPTPKVIRKRFAESQRGARFAQEDDKKWAGLFDSDLSPIDDWQAPFYRSLANEKDVDGVLLLGGGETTLNAGWIAVGRHLPILAVHGFGGSAEKIWRYLAQISPGYPAWATQTPAALVERLKKDCDKAAARRAGTLEKEQRDAAEAVEKARDAAAAAMERRQKAFASCAIVALVAILALAIEFSSSDAYPGLMFVGLILAGATGALGRAVFWGSEANEPWRSLLLGAIAGFAVGLAYLVPQLVGDPQLLTPKTPDQISHARVEFLLVVLVALSAGVGFDTVFNRLREQAGRLNVDATTGLPRSESSRGAPPRRHGAAADKPASRQQSRPAPELD